MNCPYLKIRVLAIVCVSPDSVNNGVKTPVKKLTLYWVALNLQNHPFISDEPLNVWKL